MLSGQIMKCEGAEAGPVSIVLAGVHGNEVCGVELLKRIMPTLKIERGTVYFGFGNPLAIEKNVRFVEANLNRMFKDDADLSDKEKTSYEYKRAEELKPYLSQADALLDIHASTSAESTPFAICEENADPLSKYLPIKTIVSGFDEVEPGGTDFYMNKEGKIGICVECGYLGDEKTTAIAEGCLTAFFTAQGHIDGKLCAQKQTRKRMYLNYETKGDGFQPAKAFADFEYVTRGQLIGSDQGRDVFAPDDGFILFAKETTTKGAEAFLLGREL